jgi:hypothetical protein
MKVKVLAALMMTVVMSLAAFASEQRRMCMEPTVADNRAMTAADGQESVVVTMDVNAAN